MTSHPFRDLAKTWSPGAAFPKPIVGAGRIDGQVAQADAIRQAGTLHV
jgi:hypothetical protein